MRHAARFLPSLVLAGLIALPVCAQTAPPPASIPRLDAIGTAPSAANIERDIRTLVGFGTRHTLSDTKSSTRGIGAARRWIFERASPWRHGPRRSTSRTMTQPVGEPQLVSRTMVPGR